VNLNGVTYKQVHVNQNGVVTFLNALGTFAPVTDFASLQTVVGAGNPFIAAFYPGTAALSIPRLKIPRIWVSTAALNMGVAWQIQPEPM